MGISLLGQQQDKLDCTADTLLTRSDLRLLFKYAAVWRALLKAIHSLPRPRSSGDRALASGAMSAGSNPAEGARNISLRASVPATGIKFD